MGNEDFAHMERFSSRRKKSVPNIAASFLDPDFVGLRG